MKINTLIFVLGLILITSLNPQKGSAANKTSASSAAFISTASIVEKDNRVLVLQKYLESKNSPLANSAQTFVEEADKNNLDWKFVAAISGLESGFGKQIPPNSYNGWGWGVYGNNVKGFASWDDAIETISTGLREQYMNKWNLKDVSSIGHVYAASPTWAQRVTYFMNDIEKFQKNWTDTSLSISI